MKEVETEGLIKCDGDEERVAAVVGLSNTNYHYYLVVVGCSNCADSSRLWRGTSDARCIKPVYALVNFCFRFIKQDYEGFVALYIAPVV